MRGKSDSVSRGMMAVSVLVIVAVLLLVITGFKLLHKRQESLAANAKNMKQEEATVRIETVDPGSGNYADSGELTGDSLEDTSYKEESTSEKTTGNKEIYLIKGEEKKANKYDRVDKLSYTDSVRYTKEDLNHLDEYGLCITRNEIFARHGRMFNDHEIQKYFDSQPWYVAKYSPGDFDDSCLNEIESDNVELIVDCELERGYN